MHEPRVETQRIEIQLREDAVVERYDRIGSRDISVDVARTDPRAQIEDQRLAQRIDRRIRDLGEALAQILGDRDAALEDGERRIVAHRRGRFGAAGEDGDNVFEFLARRAEATQLARQVPLRRRFDGVVERQTPRMDDLTEVGALAALGTKLLGFDDLARRETNDQAATGAQAAAADDRIVLEVDDARF